MIMRAWLAASLVVLFVACGSESSRLSHESPNYRQASRQSCLPPKTDGIIGKGTECRKWVTAATPPPQNLSPANHHFTAHPSTVPMRDGKVLYGTLYLPNDLSKPGPCVLYAGGYAPPAAAGIPAALNASITLSDLAQRGYAGAYISLRGTAPDGEALYYRYREDVYDIIEWMAAQPWCNGNVGMIGGSLDGITQWLGSLDIPPSLKAMIPEIACGDCYWYLWNKGGTFPGNGRKGRTPPGTAYDEYAAGSEHPNYDAWWQERTSDTAHHQALAAAGVSVMQCGGWDDYIFAGGMRAVEEIEQAGGNGMQLIGPCAHGGNTPTMLPYELDIWRVIWFDRYLKGVENGVAGTTDALFFVEGAELYRFEDEWPILDGRNAKLYFAAKTSGTVTSLNDGSLGAEAPNTGEPHAEYTYSPDDNHNSAGGGTVRPTNDQAPDEAISLTWTSDPLPDHTEITGWPKVEFWASINTPDTDFIFELTEVTHDGASHTISRGWLSAARYFNRSNPSPVPKGQILKYVIELWPMSHVFAAGTRIRLDLAGSDFPGTRPNVEPGRVQIYQDAKHRSFLTVPVIGTARLPGERP